MESNPVMSRCFRYGASVKLRVTFAATDEDEVLSPDDLAEIEHIVAGGRASTEPGEVGVGGAGPGITVVLEIAERAVNDFGSWVGLGLALRELIRWRKNKSHRNATITDENAFKAVAACALPAAWRDELSPTDYSGCKPLLGRAPLGSKWVGTDERDMWVATFKRPGDAIFVYLAPTGVVLGYVRVPLQTYFDGTEWVSRNDKDLDAQFKQWNGPAQ
jgi:hypothetical protein